MRENVSHWPHHLRAAATPPPPPPDKRPVWSLLLRSPTFWLLVAICAAGAGAVRWVDAVGGPLALRQSLGRMAPLLTVGIHVVVTISPFPSDPVCIANGAIYGFWLGAGLSWLGWWLAALAEFALGRRARKDFCLQTSLSRAPAWLQSFPVAHPVFLIGTRQIPWLGGHLSTFVPGAAGVPWRRYVWCSAIAVVPGAVIMSAIGAGIMRFR